MMRKLLSLLLVVTIVLAVLPAAYAASDEPGRTPDETAASALPGAPEEPQEESKEPEETLPDLTDTYEDLQQEAESILEGFFDGAQTLAGENVKSGFVRCVDYCRSAQSVKTIDDQHSCMFLFGFIGR